MGRAVSADRGSRVLLVEDEALIAFDVESALVDAGFIVVGPCASVAGALSAIAGERPAAAVLDVNLNSEFSYPIADALSRAEIPFVWMTGHSTAMLPAVHRDRPILAKPCAADAIIEAVRAVLREKSEIHLAS
jgi:DNA-binding NtrC family response regulator